MMRFHLQILNWTDIKIQIWRAWNPNPMKIQFGSPNRLSLHRRVEKFLVLVGRFGRNEKVKKYRNELKVKKSIKNKLKEVFKSERYLKT